MQTVTVTGTGVVPVVPDSAVVRLAAVARGSGVAEAYTAMAAAAATVVEVAHRHTEERRVASSGISVWPARDHEGREAGYEARHSYAIACPDLATPIPVRRTSFRGPPRTTTRVCSRSHRSNRRSPCRSRRR